MSLRQDGTVTRIGVKIKQEKLKHYLINMEKKISEKEPKTFCHIKGTSDMGFVLHSNAISGNKYLVYVVESMEPPYKIKKQLLLKSERLTFIHDSHFENVSLKVLSDTEYFVYYLLLSSDNLSNYPFCKVKFSEEIFKNEANKNFPVGKELLKCGFSKSSIVSTDFKNWKFTDNKFEDTVFHGCRFTHCDFTRIDCDSLVFNNCSFYMCKIDVSTMNGVHFADCNIMFSFYSKNIILSEDENTVENSYSYNGEISI